MKILEVGGSGTIFTDTAGPVSSDISHLSMHFSKLGHEVTVLDVENKSVKRDIPPKVKLLEVKAKSRANVAVCNLPIIKFFINQLLHLRNELRFVKGFMNSHLKVEAFDIIHVHETYPAYIFKQIYKNKPPFIVYTTHTCTWFFNPERGIRSRVRGKFDSLMQRRLIKKVDLTIALTRYLRQILPSDNITHILNGVDITLFSPGEKLENRRILGLDEKKFIVLFVSRISYIKGVDVLLKASHILKDKIPNLKVHIVGSLAGKFGQDYITIYAKKMIEMADKNVIKFWGHIDHKKLPLLYQAADIFVLPSRLEPHGLVVLEAIASGKPIISSRVGIPELIHDNFNGFLINPNDPFDLANKIYNLYTNPELTIKFGENSRQMAKDYDWVKVAKKHIDVYEKLIDNG